jgi:CPA1 family monovalent cation:H+ antiporter
MVAYGIYLLADALPTSAIMAVICAGLILGNDGRYVGMSLETRVAVDTFWGTLAFVANALIAHIAGFVTGLLITLLLRPRLQPPMPVSYPSFPRHPDAMGSVRW